MKITLVEAMNAIYNSLMLNNQLININYIFVSLHFSNFELRIIN